MGGLPLIAIHYLPGCGSVYHASCSPISRVDANVVSLICARLEVDTGGGAEGVQTTLDDGLLMGSCRGIGQRSKGLS